MQGKRAYPSLTPESGEESEKIANDREVAPLSLSRAALGGFLSETARLALIGFEHCLGEAGAG